MAIIIREENGTQAKQLLEHIKTLPFATVIEEKGKSFLEASEKYNAVSVDEFFDELDNSIRKRYAGSTDI
ncbi:hypothetical protein [Proteiniphilum sp. UBA5384]|uniref:hypothetical protein n=1 Tax=Proteiniphilum sp. UBA5384 TaxID=1947279 RepID=UPI0025EAD28A|nr:hypothetical protein [Proteiniphilum sp. UBA5384]